MPRLHHVKAGFLTVGLILVGSSAWAHGGGLGGGGLSGGTSHAGGGLAGAGVNHSLAPGITPASGPTSPVASHHGGTGSSGASSSGSSGTSSPFGTSQTSIPTPPPNFASQCEGADEVAANCEAKGEALFSASQGDPSPVWTAPVPTTIPATPTTPPISEPQSSTTQNFEQSGGGSGVVITAGGGPTLTDCMALWAPAVHMTKALWKDVCVRTMNGINEPQEALEHVDPGYRAHHAQPVSRQAHNYRGP